MQACRRHFIIPAENDQNLINRRVKCKQTEVNYRIFHSFAGNAEFCILMRDFAEKCKQFFFPQVFYDVN